MQHPALPPATAPAALLEAALYVDDLKAAQHFYADLLGLEMFQHVEGRHMFFRLNNAVLLVFNPDQTDKPPGNPNLPVPPHGTRGAGHVCFAMARDQISDMRTRLEAADVLIDTAFSWPNGAQSLYVRDPAGNSVEFAEGWLWDDA